MAEITLKIKAPENWSMTSHIRVIDEFSGAIQKSMQISGKENYSNIYIGNLNNLRNSILFIDTIVPKGVHSHIQSVNYEIFYNQERIESKILPQYTKEESSTFFYFRFKFCPRFPFC